MPQNKLAKSTRQSRPIPLPPRRGPTAASFIAEVRGLVPTARQMLVTGHDDVEETVECLLKRRGQWKNVGDDQIETVVAAIRYGFYLGAAYGAQLNPAVVLRDAQ